MREMNTALGSKELRLVANFRASMQIAEQIADPLIAKEVAIDAMMQQAGMPYKPRFSFDIKNLPKLLHIAARAGDEKLSLEDVQELVFEAGFFEAQTVAIQYMELIVGPGPAATPKTEGESDPSGED